jgi:hypothetical protein
MDLTIKTPMSEDGGIYYYDQPPAPMQQVSVASQERERDEFNSYVAECEQKYSKFIGAILEKEAKYGVEVSG